MTFLNRLPDYTLPALLTAGTFGLMLMSRRTRRTDEKERTIFPTTTTNTTPVTTTTPVQPLAKISNVGTLIYREPNPQAAQASLMGPRVVRVVAPGAEWSYVQLVPSAGTPSSPAPWPTFWVRTTELRPVETVFARCPPDHTDLPRGNPLAEQGDNMRHPWRDDGAGNSWKCIPLADPKGTF